MIESAARRLASELVDRRESINRELSRNGVRFGIYKNGEYHDRLFPYDPIPRIIESDEFDTLGGLKTACILGKAEEAPGLDVSGLDMQKLFIRLTNV